MKPSILRKALIFLLAFAVTGFTMHALVERKKSYIFQVKQMSIPTDIGDWKSVNSFGDYFGYFTKKYGSLEIMREYLNGEQRQVLYFGYHENMANQLDYHTPEICYPNMGWEIISRKEVVANVNGKKIPLLQIVIERNGARQLVTYWYQSRQVVISKMFKHQLLFVLRGMTTGKTDGGFVRISGPLNGPLEKVSVSQLEFSEKVLQVLMDQFKKLS